MRREAVITSSPVAIRGVGPVSCGAAVWRFRGQLHVTAVVKATFGFVPDSLMTVEAPGEIHAAEIHYGGDPKRSVEVAGDLSPYRKAADVVLALGGVLEDRIAIRHKAGEEFLEVAADIRVGIFLDDNGGGGVLDVQGHLPGFDSALVEERGHFAGEFVEAAPAGGDGDFVLGLAEHRSRETQGWLRIFSSDSF